MAHALLTLLGDCERGRQAWTPTSRPIRSSEGRTRCSGRDSYWYQAIPTMRDDWLRSLMNAFDKIVREHAVFRDAFGVL
jgi:hypothetical protein